MNLSDDNVRPLLALVVVIGVLLVCALLALLPLLGGVQNPQDYVSMLKDFGGLFSGIIGMVLGYYFGKSGSTRAR
jgi:hypothetical protein